MNHDQALVSVGVCAYNEEENIRYLLESVLRQKTEKVRIAEVVVVSDGSIDRTNEIVGSFSKSNVIRLIKLGKRLGKWAAVNKFLEAARSGILVLVSADVVLDEAAIENLCAPFLEDRNIGITGGHPVPVNAMDSLLGYVVNLQWYLHHKLALLRPKFGELVAFRNTIGKIAPTAVDEEHIASLFKGKGYILKYAPESIVYNKGPENIRDFFIQRRRIYAGHLFLKKDCNYEVSTLSAMRILKALLENVPAEYRGKPQWLIAAILLEATGRVLGIADTILKRTDYGFKWRIAESTKRLNEDPAGL